MDLANANKTNSNQTKRFKRVISKSEGTKKEYDFRRKKTVGAAVCSADGWMALFRRQQITDRFIVDFYCYNADLVVEVDGGIHLAQTEDDLERENHLSDPGLCVVRFTNEEVFGEIEGVLTRILDVCNRFTHPCPP